MLSSARRLFLTVCLLLAGIAVVLFVLENPQRIHLVFLGVTTKEVPVAALMILSFIIGLASCLLFSLWMLGRWRMRVVLLRRELLALSRRSKQAV